MAMHISVPLGSNPLGVAYANMQDLHGLRRRFTSNPTTR